MTTKRFMTMAAGVPATELLGGSKGRLRMVFVLALSLCGSVSGQTVWESATDGLWSDAAAWTAGVPDGNAAFLTNTAGSYAVTVGATPSAPYGDLIVSNAVGNTTRLNVNASGFTSTNGMFVFGRGAEVVANSGGVMGYTGRPASATADFIQIKNGGVWRIDGGTVDFSNLYRTTATAGNSYLYVGRGSTGRLDITSGELTLKGTTVGETNNTAGVRVGSGLGGVGELAMTGGRLTVFNNSAFTDGLIVGADAAGCRGTVSLSGDAVMTVSNYVKVGCAAGYTGSVDIAGNAALNMFRGDVSHEVGNGGYGSITVRGNATLDFWGGSYGGSLGLGRSGGTGILNLQDNGFIKVGYAGIGMCSRANGGNAELNISGGRCIQYASGYGLDMSQYWDAYNNLPVAVSTVRISGGVLSMNNGYNGSGGILMARVGTATNVRALATMEISGGVVTNKGWFIMGWGGLARAGIGDWLAATGIVTQTSGELRQTAYPLLVGMGGGYGSYTISGGQAVMSKNVFVGGTTTGAAGTVNYAGMNNTGSVGRVRIDGGTFNVTNSFNLCLGYNGTGTLTIGSNGLCVAENIILSNQVQSVVRFEFGKQGVGALTARKKLAIAAGAKLEVDSTAYEGEATWVKLIDCSTREGAFAAENITVTGGGVVVQDKDEDIWLQKSRGTVLQLL